MEISPFSFGRRPSFALGTMDDFGPPFQSTCLSFLSWPTLGADLSRWIFLLGAQLDEIPVF